MTYEHNISFITPAMCRGADGKSLDFRPASVRGQLRWWFRALHTSPETDKYDGADEAKIFGGVEGKIRSSKIQIRTQVVTRVSEPSDIFSIETGLGNGSEYRLIIQDRYLGIQDSGLRQKFERCLKAWLHLGTIGARGTRGTGSFTWEDLEGQSRYPASFVDYENSVKSIIKGTALEFSLLKEEYSTSKKAHSVAVGTKEISGCNSPLGSAPNPRKTSPLRFRIIKIGTIFRIAAIWDGRESVTGNERNDLTAAIEQLAPKTEIGRQLKNSPPRAV